jgi:rubredoxin
MEVYIAGPMTGYWDFNFKAFHDAAKVLRATGFIVRNPAEKESLVDGTPNWAVIPHEWSCPSGKGKSRTAQPGAIRRKDFEDVLKCQAVVLLEGWANSSGARAEALVAQLSGLTVWEYFEVDGKPYLTPLAETIITHTELEVYVDPCTKSGT